MTVGDQLPDRGVLIVDASSESREVLRTVLQNRGMRIWEADDARRGLALAKRHHPRVIVLDMESEAADDESVREQFDQQSASDGGSLVILASASLLRAGAAGGAEVISKPYHYAPLIRTIEQLVERASDRRRAG